MQTSVASTLCSAVVPARVFGKKPVFDEQFHLYAQVHTQMGEMVPGIQKPPLEAAPRDLTVECEPAATCIAVVVPQHPSPAALSVWVARLSKVAPRADYFCSRKSVSSLAR